MEVRCEEKDCLIDDRSGPELEIGFQSGQYSWQPSQNYSDFWGKSLREGFSKKLGTIRPERTVSLSVSSYLVDAPSTVKVPKCLGLSHQMFRCNLSGTVYSK
jgi:hypothetical protein